MLYTKNKYDQNHWISPYSRCCLENYNQQGENVDSKNYQQYKSFKNANMAEIIYWMTP